MPSKERRMLWTQPPALKEMKTAKPYLVDTEFGYCSFSLKGHSIHKIHQSSPTEDSRDSSTSLKGKGRSDMRHTQMHTYTTSHHITSLRFASHRIASHRIASHRIASSHHTTYAYTYTYMYMYIYIYIYINMYTYIYIYI